MEDAKEKNRIAVKKLVLWVVSILLAVSLLLIAAAASLERETVYTYEEISSTVVLHETEGGFWAEASLYPEAGFAMSDEVISVDEENKIRYVDLYVYLTAKTKNRYFKQTSPTPFLALWEDGSAWAPISSYDLDRQGNLIKPTPADRGSEYRYVVRRVYYAHFERIYDELTFHTEPVLLWSNKVVK